MKRLGFLTLAALGCGACATSPEIKSARYRAAAGGTAAIGLGDRAFGLAADGRIEAPRRPDSAVGRFGYTTLPLVDLHEGPPGRSATISFHPSGFHFDESVIADLKVGSSEGFLGAPGLPGGEVGIVAPAYPRCPNDGIVSDAKWVAIPLRGFFEPSIEVELVEGRFLWQGCTSVVDRSARFRAQAIVPGFVYGFRTPARTKHAAGADEEMVVILPPAAWISTSAPLGAAEVRRGVFTVVRMPVDRETGASFVVRLAPEQLERWDELRTKQRAPRWVEPTSRLVDMVVLGVDVAWAGNRAEGTYTVSLDETVERSRFEPFLRSAARGVAGLVEH